MTVRTHCLIRFVFKVYTVAPIGRRRKGQPYIFVEVDQHNGSISIQGRSTWNGKRLDQQAKPLSREFYALEREVIDYLAEWELVEWRSIGPEDREVFATNKLLGESDE